MKNITPKEVIDGIAVMCSYDKLMSITDIKLNPQNPKQHIENEVQLLSRMIQSEGWRAPVILSKRSGFVIQGHGRILAAQKLDAEFIPVNYQDYDNEAQEKANLIGNGQETKLADTDENMLRELLQEIKDGALEMDLDL